MRRNILRRFGYAPAIVLGLLVLAALSFLIYESRTVSDDYYVSQADRARTIENLKLDIDSALGMFQNAYVSGAEVPRAARTMLLRLEQEGSRLQNLSQLPRAGADLAPLFDRFDETLGQLVASGQSFADMQDSMATALRSVQDQAPDQVRTLRAAGLGPESQQLFVVAIELIEFSTRPFVSSDNLMGPRVQALRSAADALPGDTGQSIVPVLDDAQLVVDQHVAAGGLLSALLNTGAAGRLASLSDAVFAADRQIVRRAELARLMLAVCALLLLIGISFALLRLQASYRELNRSNEALERVNNELEDRVVARTTMLSEANDQLKASQSQLIHAEKMSSLGQMVAGISHEINTPLWYLMNNSAIVQERLEVISELCDIAKRMTDAVKSRTAVRETVEKGLNDMHRLLHDGIDEDIEEAKSLVQDSIKGLDDLTLLAQGLKDFSRLDRAVQGKFSVNEGLDKALLIARNRIRKRIEVHKYYGDVPPVHCSPSQINQVFLNLLTNAADAIKDKGDLVIRTWEEHGRVGISISDSGVGISPDVLPRIRDPFFTTKEVGNGTGLGLSIVDQIVTQHNGDLRIESAPGQGTCVTVLLPVSPHPANVQKGEDIDMPDVDMAAVASMQQAGDAHTGNGQLSN